MGSLKDQDAKKKKKKSWVSESEKDSFIVSTPVRWGWGWGEGAAGADPKADKSGVSQSKKFIKSRKALQWRGRRKTRNMPKSGNRGRRLETHCWREQRSKTSPSSGSVESRAVTAVQTQGARIIRH